jgi:hypothetical protein
MVASNPKDISMPSNVIKFEMLVYMSLGIGAIMAIIQFDELARKAGFEFVLAVQAFVFFLILLLTWLAARRRQNWARWIFLGMFVLGTFAYIPTAGETWRGNFLGGILSSVQIFLQGGAVYFVFSGNAPDWFKRSAASQPET